MNRADLLAALAWQVDLGADEAVQDRPVDRFAESDSPKPATPAPRVDAAAPESGEPAAESGAEIAARADSLEDLQRALAAWDGSDLKKGARNCVFSDGLPGAHLMIVGEAPGANEDREGKPFVGRAGHLLDRMLAAIGLDRNSTEPENSAYIANILPWRPPSNRTPSEREVALFLPFIERHIALARPRLLFAVGNTPTKALLGTKDGIRRMRGRWRRHGPSGLPLLPSFHPAYLLRQPAEKRSSWLDLQALRRALDGETPDVEERLP